MQTEVIFNALPRRIRQILQLEILDFRNLQEIRLRIGKPLLFIYEGSEHRPKKPYIVTKEDLRETLEYISHYSLYAYEQDMKQGFITIEGGHRVGMTGQAIMENGKVKNLKHISSMNVRICHEVPGCADNIFPYITGRKKLYHTLIVSPPRCGKTTLLRDVIRQISDGNDYVEGMSVGVVDERSEIGGKADYYALEYAMHCGCKMLATVHAGSMEELRQRPLFSQMIAERRFERYIVLGNQGRIGTVEGIYNERGDILYREQERKQE